MEFDSHEDTIIFNITRQGDRSPSPSLSLSLSLSLPSFFFSVRKANMLRTRRKTRGYRRKCRCGFAACCTPSFLSLSFFFDEGYCESRGRKKRARCVPSTRHGDSPRFATLWKPGISLLILLRNAHSGGGGDGTRYIRASSVRGRHHK